MHSKNTKVSHFILEYMKFNGRVMPLFSTLGHVV